MKTFYFLKGIGIAIFLMGSLLPTWANEIEQNVPYELTREKVKSARILENQNGFFDVVVELTDVERKTLSIATKANVGKELWIIFSGQVITRAIIRAKIDSGIIRIGRWSSEEQAMVFIKTLLPQFTEQR
jgi:preprotein translocase subunit SecD